MDTISASRIAAMLGIDPRQSRLSLYLELRGELPPIEDNEVLREGRYFEDAIARIACEKFGFEPIKLDFPRDERGYVLRDGVLSGHADRIVRDDTGKIAILEVKNTLFGVAGKGEWGDPGSDVVPRAYWLQVQCYVALLHAQMQALGVRTDPGDYYHLADYGYIAARLHHGTELYKVPHDPEVVASIREQATAFLQAVQDGVPPEPQDEHDQRMRWLADPAKEVVGGPEQAAWVDTLRSLAAQRKEIEKQESDLKHLLLGFARDASKIMLPHPTTGEPVCIATLAADRQFDAEAFVRDNPQLAAQYQRLDTSRLGKEQRKVYDLYMKQPASAVDQKRTIRLKEIKL